MNKVSRWLPVALLVCSGNVLAAETPAAPPEGGGRGPGGYHGGALEKCRENPEECREKMKQRFEERYKNADSDGNGTLSKDEFSKGYPHMAEHFDKIDANQDGQVTKEEMRGFGAQRRHEHFAERFKKSDSDGNGTLSKDEFSKGYPRMAERFDKVDANHDGQVSQDELRALHKEGHGWRHGAGGPPEAAPTPAPGATPEGQTKP